MLIDLDIKIINFYIQIYEIPKEFRFVPKPFRDYRQILNLRTPNHSEVIIIYI
jgi:hypothetical protein